MIRFFIYITSVIALPSICFSKCFVPGKCSGTAYTLEKIINVEKCIWKCWKSPICQWSSYDPTNNFCYYYQYDSDCDEINDSNCTQCLTNVKDCQEESEFHNFKMYKSPKNSNYNYTKL